MPTPPLVVSCSPLEIEPIGRLAAGRLEPLGPWFPPEGPLGLVLWRPGEAPAFAWAPGLARRDGRGWRFEGAGEGWIVLCVGAPALGF